MWPFPSAIRFHAPAKGFPAQGIATGPTIRNSAMPETFETLMYAARRRLVITTPYYVPNEAMQAALCAAAGRGVDTTIIFPARCDSRITAAASRSYYRELLEAGVKIHEYVGGLLHTKSMVVDDDVTLIGSANMDRRSFDLNYENNILFWDEALTTEMHERQKAYLASSNEATLEEVKAWSPLRRLWNNTLGMLGPLLQRGRSIQIRSRRLSKSGGGAASATSRISRLRSGRRWPEDGMRDVTVTSGQTLGPWHPPWRTAPSGRTSATSSSAES